MGDCNNFVVMTLSSMKGSFNLILNMLRKKNKAKIMYVVHVSKR